MTTHTLDGQALLAAILDDPADDLPRLAYADWLDENGEAARAAAIRYAIWVAKANDGEPVDYMPPSHDHSDWHAVRKLLGHDKVTTGSSRGFVARVELPLADFLAHAEALFRAHPIEHVALTCREPTPDSRDQTWGWYKRHPGSRFSGDEGELPPAIWDNLDGCDIREDGQVGAGLWSNYHDRAAALDSLSRACVAYGRSLRRR